MFTVVFRPLTAPELKHEAVTLLAAIEEASRILRQYGRESEMFLVIETPDGERITYAAACERAGVF